MNFNKLIKIPILVFAIATLLAGCKSNIMVESPPISSINNKKALITFMLPSSITDLGPSGMNIKPTEFNLWDRDKFIGAISKKTLVQYLAEPGEHAFFVRGQNWSIIKANLEAGKKYYVIVNIYPRFVKHSVAFQVVKPGSEQMEISLPKWLNRLTPIKIIPEKYDNYEQKRKQNIQRAIRNYEAGRAKYTLLEAKEGI
ncbi:MAG: hypothetical protein GY710_18660 [Desulfobacteraceae bacterium]|nr:hypothetical protein [Desulfobacteraceae bacterium]